VKVLYDGDGEVAAIFVQLERQRKLYKKYGKVLELDGTYKTTRAGFALYHILIEDNNGDGQPVAKFFIKEETIEAIAECLRVFSEDCAEISALGRYFPSATHLLCQFHALKSVDFHLNKVNDGEHVDIEKRHQIRKHFRTAMYATTQDDFDSAKAFLLSQDGGTGSTATYFRDHWFNIETKWTHLGRRHLPTFGNNRTNRLERQV
ncbi:Uncharacterized protein APZ42_002218, partial [Daphnia magna]